MQSFSWFVELGPMQMIYLLNSTLGGTTLMSMVVSIGTLFVTGTTLKSAVVFLGAIVSEASVSGSLAAWMPPFLPNTDINKKNPVRFH
jgi:hypothetical protein